MSDEVMLALISAVPPTLVALANLIATIRGQRKTQLGQEEILKTADGNKNMIIEAVGRVSKVEGKVDVLEHTPRTVVIGERRKEPSPTRHDPERRSIPRLADEPE
jgi:hypothetical protein